MEEGCTSPSRSSDRRLILTAQEWIDLELSNDEQGVVLGTTQNALVRPATKNLIVAPEKSFKTTFLLRLMAGLSCGETVFPMLPVARKRRVLYLHGELSTAEIKDRTRPAFSDLSEPYTEFFQGRMIDGHLIEESGQKSITEILRGYRPDDLVIDPWQSFIQGYDENSFKDMSKAISFCNQLIEDSAITLWIAFHFGKEASRGPRGHSSINGWRDTLFKLRRDGDCATVTVEPRWATPPKPFWLRRTGGTMALETGGPSSNSNTGKICSFITSSGGRALKNDVVGYLGTSPEAARKAIQRACDSGTIRQDGDSVILGITDSCNDSSAVH